MLDKLEAIHLRFMELEEKLADPEIITDNQKYSKIHKEYKDLLEIVDAYHRYKNILGNIKTAKSMLSDEDEEMKQMARAELEDFVEQKETLEEEIKQFLIPKDPDDTKDVIFEIRAGTGGDEASIFAGDLYKMYTKYFENQDWQVEILDVNEGTVGGFNKIVLEITGKEVYGNLKFESGAHRVQRIPKTESQGRVHTSAATVAVLPKYEEADIDIRKEDIRVDTFRSSGAGGQHVNKTESGVRFTHLPTGIVAESTDSRSQIKNRDIAMQRLYQKIKDIQRKESVDKQTKQRRSLVGSGDRSDKIRTYNYPQNRVTDHRINLTLYNLENIMNGDIEEIIEGLQLAENAQKLKEGAIMS